MPSTSHERVTGSSRSVRHQRARHLPFGVSHVTSRSGATMAALEPARRASLSPLLSLSPLPLELAALTSWNSWRPPGTLGALGVFLIFNIFFPTFGALT